MQSRNHSGRRSFLKASLALSAGLTGIPAFAGGNSMHEKPAGLFMIGPMEGYSPHIGTIVSMMNYNRDTILRGTKALKVEELDHLHDQGSNTIGGLLMHLGAVDKWYQLHCFEGRDTWTDAEEKIWKAGMELGDEGRKKIKGKDVKYYHDLITEVREKTLAELKKRDDNWLLSVDESFSRGDQKFNYYWEWFHVCEHESNHRGQITWLKGRLPGAKPGND